MSIYPVTFKKQVRYILGDMSMDPGLSPAVYVKLKEDRYIKDGRLYLQCVAPSRRDVDTHKTGEGGGGKLYLSPHVCESELVQAAFGLIDSYYHHEVREHFRYKGKRVFGPHIDINAYLAIADTLATRTQL